MKNYIHITWKRVSASYISSNFISYTNVRFRPKTTSGAGFSFITYRRYFCIHARYIGFNYVFRKWGYGLGTLFLITNIPSQNIKLIILSSIDYVRSVLSSLLTKIGLQILIENSLY